MAQQMMNCSDLPTVSQTACTAICCPNRVENELHLCNEHCNRGLSLFQKPYVLAIEVRKLSVNLSARTYMCSPFRRNQDRVFAVEDVSQARGMWRRNEANYLQVLYYKQIPPKRALAGSLKLLSTNMRTRCLTKRISTYNSQDTLDSNRSTTHAQQHRRICGIKGTNRQRLIVNCGTDFYKLNYEFAVAILKERLSKLSCCRGALSKPELLYNQSSLYSIDVSGGPRKVDKGPKS